MLCVVCSVHWVFYSVLFCSVLYWAVLYWAALYCAVLLWCSASAVVCSLYKFSSAKNSSQLALLCVLCCVLCSQLPPYRSVSVCSTYYYGALRTAFAFSGISNTQNECQPGRHTQAYTGRRQAEPVSQPETAAASSTVRRKRRHWECICICVSFACVYLCVSFIRSLGTFRWLVRSMCAKQRQQHITAQRTHTHTAHVRVYLALALAWPRFHSMRSWTKILLFVIWTHGDSSSSSSSQSELMDSGGAYAAMVVGKGRGTANGNQHWIWPPACLACPAPNGLLRTLMQLSENFGWNIENTNSLDKGEQVYKWKISQI